ncbi:MAG TPA: DUF1206 domain-containing protein [Chitinophagaceae bacterium]|nr:DUF1206 domain-containing protein [Chitinophagaceae bacterium]
MDNSNNSGKRKLAQAGLIAKGIVYCLVAVLAFMSAFQVMGRRASGADKEGALKLVEEQTGGQVLLLVISLGLVCYSIWRMIEAFNRDGKSDSKKQWLKTLRYLFSAFIYLSLAFLAAKIALNQSDGGGGRGSTETLVESLLSKPAGQALVVIVALIILGTGIYQIWYGLSEKYQKHVSSLNLHSQANRLLLISGKAGYLARGLVWIVISYLIFRAAMQSDAAAAGNTSEAFAFLKNAAYGKWLLGATSVGLFGYGVFNFIRARYERL